MKAKLILIFVLMALCGKVFAQDKIYTVDGRCIEAKVLEISDEDIAYKTYDNPDGPLYRMGVGRVARIVFENGTEKSFAPSSILVPSPYAFDPYGRDGLLQYRHGHYYNRHGRLHAEDMRDYLGVSLYGNEYLKAKGQYLWGIWLTIGGATLIVSSAVSALMEADYNRGVSSIDMPSTMHESASSDMTALYIAGGVAGAACLGAGIPLWRKGAGRLGAIADDYNSRYGRKAYGQGAGLNLGPTSGGVGLALIF